MGVLLLLWSSLRKGFIYATQSRICFRNTTCIFYLKKRTSTRPMPQFNVEALHVTMYFCGFSALLCDCLWEVFWDHWNERDTPKGERCKVVHFNFQGLVFTLSLFRSEWMELLLGLVNNNPAESVVWCFSTFPSSVTRTWVCCLIQ